MKKQEITIPKGCRAIIEDGIIIIEEIQKKKPDFKKGDFLIGKSNVIVIFKRHSDFSAFESFASNTNLDNDGWLLEKFNFCSQEEKQEMIDFLYSKNKEWDAEKLEVVDIDFPKEMDTYFFPALNSYMYLNTEFESDNDGDVFRKKHNLCFRTKEEAIAKTKEFLNIK